MVNAIKQTIDNLFNPSVLATSGGSISAMEPRSDVAEVNDFQERVAKNIYEAKKQRLLLEQHIQILENTANEAGGMLWRKDNEGLYQFANRYRCTHFLRLHENCFNTVIGYSDIDIINDYIERTGLWHGFALHEDITDAHVQKLGYEGVYVTIGVIGTEEKLFKSIKTPIYIDREYDGIVGFASDLTFDCTGIIHTLEHGLYTNTVEMLNEGCFWIKDPKTCLIKKPVAEQVVERTQQMVQRYKEKKHFSEGL